VHSLLTGTGAAI